MTTRTGGVPRRRKQGYLIYLDAKIRARLKDLCRARTTATRSGRRVTEAELIREFIWKGLDAEGTQPGGPDPPGR